MRYRFGPFELDSDRLLLFRGRRAIAIEPKPLGVLVHLLERHPVVVGKPELLDAVWSGVAVTPASLTRAVRGLRRALGERADGDSVIRTVRGGGYAIAVPVSRHADGHLPSRRSEVVERPLIGRERELRGLASALARASAGRGGVCTVSGEPGIGKTRLVEAVARRAAGAGWTVLVGNCFASGAASAMSPWSQVVRAAAATLSPQSVAAAMGPGTEPLIRLAPELSAKPEVMSRGADRESWSDGSGHEHFQMLEACDRFFHALSKHRPLLVVLDDLQWADSSSLEVLEFVAGRASRRAIVLLVCHRPTNEGPLREVLDRLARLPDVLPLLPLSGMSVDELSQLAEAEAGFPLGPSQRSSLHERTGGNPYFAIELARAGALQPEGEAPIVNHPEGVPERIRAVVRGRVEGLTSAAQELLRLAAVLPNDLELSLLARILERSDLALLDPLEEAMTAELLRELPTETAGSRRFAFVHALVGEALYEVMPRSERARAHGRVAAALEALHVAEPGAHLATLAYHYGEATGDIDRAVHWAQRAGDQAHSRFAFEDAAAHYMRALNWLSGSAVRTDARLARLLGALARTRMAQGDPEAAESAAWEALAHARHAGEPALVAELAWPLTTSRFRGRPPEQVAEVIEEALMQVGKDVSTEARLTAILARTLSYTSAFDRVEELSSRALELARASGDTQSELQALFVRDVVLTSDPRFPLRRIVSRDRLGLALEFGDRKEEFHARIFAAVRLIQEAQVEELGRQTLELERLRAERLGELRPEAMLLDLQSLRAICEGRLADAREMLPRLRELWAGVDPLYGKMSIAAKTQMFEWMVRVPVVARDASAQVPIGPGLYALPRPYQCASALRLLDDGRDFEAREIFGYLSRLDYRDSQHDATYLIILVQLAELAHRLDDRERARQLADHLEAYAGCYAASHTTAARGAVDRYRALLAFTVGEYALADSLLARAIETEQRMGARPWEILARIDRARLQFAQGGAVRHARALSDLDAADALCDALDTPGIRARLNAVRVRFTSV